MASPENRSHDNLAPLKSTESMTSLILISQVLAKSGFGNFGSSCSKHRFRGTSIPRLPDRSSIDSYRWGYQGFSRRYIHAEGALVGTVCRIVPMAFNNFLGDGRNL
jgi:hypothetical protein